MHHRVWLNSVRVCAVVATLGCAVVSGQTTDRAPASHTESSPADGVSLIATRSDLEAIGVRVYLKHLDTPGASTSFEAVADKASNAGDFVRSECIVLRDPAGMDDLLKTDSSANLAELVARRNASDKLDSTFLVLGREVSRAYLAFEFSNPGKPNQRYLLPVPLLPRHPS